MFQRLGELTVECLALLKAKNADYGNSWRRYGAKGVLVRLGDKVERLRTLLWLKQDAQVRTESIRDTARDLINYSLLLLLLIEEEDWEGMP